MRNAGHRFVIPNAVRNLIPIRFQRSVFSGRKAIFQIA